MYKETELHLESAFVDFPIEEEPLAQASMRLRPHHIGMREVRDALLVRRSPRDIASFFKNSYANGNIDPDLGEVYVADIVGSGTPDELERYHDGLRAFFTDLGNLSDRSSVEFDLTPDGMCQASCVGRHCMATNLTYNGKGFVDTEAGELRFIKKIEELLIYSGFIEGQDYEFEEKQHVLQDFRDRHFNTRRKPIPVTIDFPALTVRTSALRYIAAGFGEDLQAHRR